MSKQRILCIEDDKTLSEAYASKLTMEGFEVETVMDGSQAIIKLEDTEYDLILLDLMLPKIGGIEILELLRASKWTNANKPVIILSALNNNSDMNKAKELGVNDYLVKSDVSPDSVLEKIRENLK